MLVNDSALLEELLVCKVFLFAAAAKVEVRPTVCRRRWLWLGFITSNLPWLTRTVCQPRNHSWIAQHLLKWMFDSRVWNRAVTSLDSALKSEASGHPTSKSLSVCFIPVQVGPVWWGSVSLSEWSSQQGSPTTPTGTHVPFSILLQKHRASSNLSIRESKTPPSTSCPHPASHSPPHKPALCVSQTGRDSSAPLSPQHTQEEQEGQEVEEKVKDKESASSRRTHINILTSRAGQNLTVK